jgi:hypothetical protein
MINFTWPFSKKTKEFQIVCLSRKTVLTDKFDKFDKFDEVDDYENSRNIDLNTDHRIYKICCNIYCLINGDYCCYCKNSCIKMCNNCKSKGQICCNKTNWKILN